MNPIRTLLPWSLGLLLGLPTLSFGQNDLCSGALPIACGQTLSGSTISATADPEACVGNNTAPGIWYTFTGTDSSDPLAPAGAPGDQVTLSTWCQADYDSKIDVFSGTCGALVCVAGNDDTFGCSDVDSEISFATTVGTTYQVLVSGFNATSSGTFDLTMSCAAACVPVPANDDCSNAQVLTVAAYGTLVPTIGDNTCAASALNGPTCNPYGNIQDVWYTFNSGGSAEVLLTVSKTSLTQLNVVIYEGSCLGTELYCEKDLDSLHHQLPTTPNTDYYVQVYSNGPSVAGSFAIGVQASTCPNATPITCGQVIIGNTTGASVEPVVCIGNNTAPGVWYTFTGANSNDPGAAVGSTGDYIFLSTCGSNYDTKIDVFEGSCGALICVGGADDTDPEPGCLASGARVVLPTTVGTTYYVLVSGKNASDFGAFDLSMTCAPASSGPTVNIPQNGMKYVTCGGPFDLRDAGGYGNYPSSCSGYTLLQATPTSAVTIAGDLSLSDPDDYLAIYTGSGLETLVAVYDWNDGFLSYTGQPGESAIVYFFSDGDANVGPGFGLSVNWIGGCEPPANQDCANATSITCGQIINGSTSGALAHPEACVGDNTAPGVWYTFTGANSNDPGAAVGSAGDHVYLSTCGSGYDTKLDVFTGSCGALTCVAGVDDSHPTNCLPGRARLVVPTTVGTTYFILVSGKDASASGNFALTMDCAPAETGPVVLVPQTGMNYVPCGTNVTLQDAGGTGNYPSNCSGYTILEARNNSTISITGSVTFTQQEPADYLSIYRGSGFENLIASYGSDQNVAVNITGQPGEPLIVYFFSDGGVNNSAPGFDLNVTWSGPCEPATNQNCANATPISCGQTLSGYTNGASVEPDACIGNNTAPGVWYTFTGANSDDPGAAIGSAGDLVYLSTCGGTLYDTKIDVFEGSCGALTCVDGNDDPASNFCFFGSRVVFPTTVGTTYYVLVSGKDATDFGDFDLSMTCGTEATGPVVLMPQTGMNYVTCGSNVTLQDAGGTGNYLDNSSGYTVFEASEFASISLSGNVVFDDEQMDVLSIYAGSGFGTLLHTTANSGNINVSAPVGEPVIVYFQSDNFSNAAGLNLNVTYSGPCAPDTNQTCAQATPIACGQTISGTTHWATTEAIACVGNNTAPGVWYTFTGADSNDPGAAPGSAGDYIFLSTCGAADYDSKIDVFEGSCGALTCVAGNDDSNPFLGCSSGSRLYFPTTVGTTYYILVSGKDASASGNFELTMDCAPAQGGPVVLVPQTGANYLHCGTDVTLRDAGDLGNYPDNASGYTILEATGSSAITLSGTVVFDDEQVDQLAIYTGTGLETLEAAFYNSGPVNFTGQPGESVIVFFYSDNFGHAAGFDLNVSWSEGCAQPANDYCFGAIPLLCGQVVNGSTGGVDPDASTCAGTVPSPGLWYTITGQNTNDPQAAAGSVGDVVELRTCGDAGFDTRIDVFEGSCGALTCLTSSDDGYATACGANKSRANFQSVVGTTYYILVTGTDASSYGTFDLTVDCGQVAELPVARVPPDGINYVPCGTNVTLRDWGNLGNYPNNANGYTVLQAGHTATVTLNGSYTLDGDDHLAVFRGAGTNDLVGEYFGSGTINFTGLPGEPITVFFYSDATTTAQGFDLNVTYTGACVAPVNELCTDAIPITCGTTVNGTTVGASGDGAPTCFGGSNMPGVWYSFTGENSNDPLAATGTPGDLVTLSSCPGDINDQLRLEVFEGDCNTMSCIVGSEANGFSPGCSFGSDLSINTMVGATYYVLVSFASPTDFGAFDLTMNCEALCTPMATNGLCTGAEPIPVTPYGTQSWTVANNSCVPLGTFYSTDCTDPTMPNSWSTWYSFTTGSVGNVHLGVEPITTYGFIFAEVYTACGATTNLCAEGDPAISYTFNLQPFSDYWMRIGTYTATSRGYYEISLAEANLPPPPGDYCNTAIPITIGTPVSGNNSWATNGPDEQGGCDFFQLAGDKGVWYTLAGVDGMMTASICNEDDKIIRVLSGSCGNLTCVESQTEVCGNGGFRVTWPASADSTYYLVVGVCCGAPAGPYTLLVEQDVRIGIQARAFLQGPYDQATGLMRDDLRVNFLIPTETILHAPITYNTGPDAMVDWVTVELRDAADGQTVVDSWDVLVQADGSMINGWGVTFQSFNAPPGNYYVAVHHRNHLSVMSATPIALGGTLDVIDFTDGSTPTYGTDAQVDINGVKAMWCGDVNGDGVIKYTGSGNDRDEVLQVIGGVIPTNTTSGRYDADVNLDGQVKYTGANNDRDMILQNIGGTIPTATRNEQMP